MARNKQFKKGVKKEDFSIKIEQIIDNLEKSYNVFKKYITDKNFKKVNDKILGWERYTSGIPKIIYVKEYEDLINNKQFSFILKENDGITNQEILGLVQIYYEYSNENLLTKFRLAFYPKPNILFIENDEISQYLSITDDDLFKEIYSLYSEYFGYDFEMSNTTHIRFDYDIKVTSHPKQHLQVGSINEIRFPIYQLLLPFNFIDFLLKNLLPSAHNSIRLNKDYKYLKTESHKLILHDKESEDIETTFYLTLKNKN